MSDVTEGPRRVGSAAARAWTFDPESGELVGPSGTARLAPQPAALLALLVARGGEVVDRTRIKDHLWPGGRVEFDQGIAFAVREIRKGLEEVGVDPATVETLPRRGFRLRPPEGGDGAGRLRGHPRERLESVGVGADRRAREAGAESVPREARRVPRVGTLATAFAVALGLVLMLWASGRADRSYSSGAARPVVAVFPYEPVGEVPAGGDPDALGLALTARLTEALSGDVGVVGPTGTADLAGPNDTDAARDRLAACLVVSGTVRWTSPDTVVVFSQIVRTADRVHVWARWDTLPADDVADLVSSAGLEPVVDALAAC